MSKTSEKPPAARVTRCPTCRRRYKRSGEANRKYWALVYAVAEKLQPQGELYSAETWHIYFKSKFLGRDDVLMPNKRELSIPRSTADLDVSEFSDYFDKVQAFANEHGVFLEDMEGAA